MTEAIARARPIASPYGRCGYHGLTYWWLVGEVVRRVTGMRVRDALRTFLAEPLGLDGLYLGAPESERGRLAMLLVPSTRTPTAWNRFTYWVLRRTVALCGLDPERTRSALLPHGWLDVFFSTRVLDAEIPAFNGVFTARSLARMYAMLAAGGVLDGTRFISEATIRRATQVHGRGLDNVVGFPMRWRLGYHFVGTHRGVLQNAFGHFGYGGSGAWGDPDRDMSLALTLNRVAGTPFGDMRMVILSGIAARCADLARRRGILQHGPYAKSA